MLTTLLAGATALAPLPCTAPVQDRPVAFDATRLREGRFTYNLVFKGQQLGVFVISVRHRARDEWRFVADGAGQHWEAIATRMMVPRRASLSMPRRGGRYTMTVLYADRIATGNERETPASAAPVDRRTRALIIRQTVDQRIDWAAILASGLRPGERLGFDVYDPATGSSHVTAYAESGPIVGSPIGRMPTTRLHYRICKGGQPDEPEDYIVHTTLRAPYVMLREDMRSDLVSTLTKVEP